MAVHLVESISLHKPEKLKSMIDPLIGNKVEVSSGRGPVEYSAVLKDVELTQGGVTLKLEGNTLASDVSISSGMERSNSHDVRRLRNGSIQVQFFRGSDRKYLITTQKSENA